MPPPFYDVPPPPRYRSRSPVYKRHRRGDDPYFPRDSYRGGPRSPPSYDPYYPESRRQPSPPPREQLGPLSFKQFLIDQPDDLTPEEAQARYRGYLVEYHGSEIKAEFMQTRNDENVRAAFDPRSFEKTLAKRNEEAQESAARFAEDFKSGIISPSEPGFNQGMLELAPKTHAPGADAKKEGDKKEGEDAASHAPPVVWRPARIARDLALSRRLMRKLDWEKGISVENPLVPPKSEEDQAVQAEAEAANASDAAAAKEEGKDKPPERYADVKEEDAVVDSSNYDEQVGRLDLQLSYLWRVHGIDYYSGYELAASEFGQRLTACRLLRGPKPEMKEEEKGMEVDGKDSSVDGKGNAGAAGAEGMDVDQKGGDAEKGEVKKEAGQENEAGQDGKAGKEEGEEDGQEVKKEGDQGEAKAEGGQVEMKKEEEGGAKQGEPNGQKAEQKGEAKEGQQQQQQQGKQQQQQQGKPQQEQAQQGGSKGEDIEAARQLEMVRQKVDEVWNRRMAEGDPLEAKCMRKRVEEALDEWVESQIICHADNK